MSPLCLSKAACGEAPFLWDAKRAPGASQLERPGSALWRQPWSLNASVSGSLSRADGSPLAQDSTLSDGKLSQPCP